MAPLIVLLLWLMIFVCLITLMMLFVKLCLMVFVCLTTSVMLFVKLCLMIFVCLTTSVMLFVKLCLMVFVCLTTSVMLFVKKVYILVKLFRKHFERIGKRKREAMGRENAVLQRKLEEVESGIERLMEHPSSTYIYDDDDGTKVSLYRTARKIDFIKNLLTAEMNSCSPHRLENLNRMATRLSILQNTFVDWASPTSRFSKLDEILANWMESADNNGAVDKCPDVELHGHGRQRKKKGRKRMRSYMAMGCASIAGFITALILMALADIPYVEETLANIPYVEETVYLFPT